MTTADDMQQLSARLAVLKRRQQLESIQEAYDALDAAIDDASELSNDECGSLREWGNVNFSLLQQADSDDSEEDERSNGDGGLSPFKVVAALSEIIKFMTAQHKQGSGLPADHPVLPAVDIICRWLGPITDVQRKERHSNQ